MAKEPKPFKPTNQELTAIIGIGLIVITIIWIFMFIPVRYSQDATPAGYITVGGLREIKTTTNYDNAETYNGYYNLRLYCIDGLVYMQFDRSLSIKFDKNTMKPELCEK